MNSLISMSEKDAMVDGVRLITDEAELIEKLHHDRIVGIDLETTGFSAWRDRIALVQFYGDDTGALGMVQLQDGIVPQWIKDLFKPGKLFIAHNGVNFDLQFLKTHGVDWERSEWYDTLVGEMVTTVTGRRDVRINLAASVKRRLGISLNKDIEHGNWEGELSEEKLMYAARDVVHLPALMRAQIAKAKDLQVSGALKDEMRAMPVFAKMTFNGMPLREDILRAWLGEEKVKADAAAVRMREVIGDINFNSVQQLQAAFRARGVRLPDTQRETMEAYVNDGFDRNGVVSALLDYRKPAHRLKMYNDRWIKEHIQDGRIHPRFWQCAADTTRVSSSDPNAQQIPKDGRKIVGNLDGHTIVSADYGQIEVRVGAYICKDEELLEAIEREDVHTAVGARLSEISESEITAAMRKIAKTANWILLFGGGADRFRAVAQAMDPTISDDHATESYMRFFEVFKGVAARRRHAIRRTRSGKPVGIRLLNGHYRLLTGKKVSPTTFLNTEIQGNACVGMKRGMIEADRRGLSECLGLTVHDELVACVPDNEAKEYGAELAESMVVGMNEIIPVPIVVELKSGFFWQQ